VIHAGRDKKASTAPARSAGLSPGQASSNQPRDGRLSEAHKRLHGGGLDLLGLAELEQLRHEDLDVLERRQDQRADRGHPVRDRALLIGSGLPGSPEQVGEDGFGLAAPGPGERAAAGCRQLYDQAADQVPAQRLFPFG